MAGYPANRNQISGTSLDMTRGKRNRRLEKETSKIMQETSVNFKLRMHLSMLVLVGKFWNWAQDEVQYN